MNFEKIILEKMSQKTSKELDQKVLQQIVFEPQVSTPLEWGVLLGPLSVVFFTILIIKSSSYSHNFEVVINNQDLVQNYKEIELMNSASVLNENDWKELNEDII